MVSPNFQSNYPNKVGKRYTITVSQGSVIKVKFITFDLEKKYQNRCVDHLSAKDRDGSLLMRKSCGSSLPHSFTSKSNKVVFAFITDYADTKQGYKLSLREVKEK